MNRILSEQAIAAHLKRLLALLTDERHPQELPGRQCRSAFIHPILLRVLGQGLPFTYSPLNAAPTMTLYHETASTNLSRVAPISKRSINGLPFVFVHFRKEKPRAGPIFICPTKIHSA